MFTGEFIELLVSTGGSLSQMFHSFLQFSHYLILNYVSQLKTSLDSVMCISYKCDKGHSNDHLWGEIVKRFL